MNPSTLVKLLTRASEVSPNGGDFTSALQAAMAAEHGTPASLEGLREIATAVERAASLGAFVLEAAGNASEAIAELFSGDDAAELARINAAQPVSGEKIKPAFGPGSAIPADVVADEFETMTADQMRALLRAKANDEKEPAKKAAPRKKRAARKV